MKGRLKRFFANGGSIFGGTSKFDQAVGSINKSRNSSIESIEDEYIDPNSGWKAAGKIGMSVAKAGIGVATAAATGGIGVGDAAGGVLDVLGTTAGVIQGRKAGEEMIDNVNKVADGQVGATTTARTASITAALNKNSEYKEGGEIRGPGTGKSDSIDATMDSGDFIVPTENAKKAMEIGQDLLGWSRGQKATLTEGNRPDIKLSNGEVAFSREEATLLRNAGIDIDSLAPNGKTNSNNKAMGGNIADTFKSMSTRDKIVTGLSIGQVAAGIGIGAQKDKGLPTYDKVDTSLLANAGGGFRNLAQKIKDKGRKVADLMRSSVGRAANQTFATEQEAISEKSGGNSAAYLATVGKAGRRRNASILEGESAVAKQIGDTEMKAASIAAEGLKETNAANRTIASIKGSENALEYKSKSVYNQALDTGKAATSGNLISSGISNGIGYLDSQTEKEKKSVRDANKRISVEGGPSVPEKLKGKTNISAVADGKFDLESDYDPGNLDEQELAKLKKKYKK